MATLDKMSQDKKGKKNKGGGGMNAAVASTEKIRSWVSIYRSFNTLLERACD